MTASDESERSGSDASDSEAREEERFAEAVGEESPEGRPGDSQLHSRGLMLLLLVLGGSLLVIALLVGLRTNIAIGAVIAVFGVLLMVANPVVWATLFRAAERRKVDRKQRG